MELEEAVELYLKIKNGTATKYEIWEYESIIYTACVDPEVAEWMVREKVKSINEDCSSKSKR